MNYWDFLDLLQFIAERRLNVIYNDNNTSNLNTIRTTDSNINNIITNQMSSSFNIFNEYSLNDYHIRYDLKCIHRVLENMLNDPLICKNGNNIENDNDTTNTDELYQRCQHLIQQTKIF